MEFTLEFPFMRDILEQENARPRDEIHPDVPIARAVATSGGPRLLASGVDPSLKGSELRHVG